MLSIAIKLNVILDFYWSSCLAYNFRIKCFKNDCRRVAIVASYSVIYIVSFATFDRNTYLHYNVYNVLYGAAGEKF